MKWFPDYFNDIGFIATILGFIFTIIPLWLLRNATNKAIKRLANSENLIAITTGVNAIGPTKKALSNKLFIEADGNIREIKKALMASKNVCKSEAERIDNQLGILSANQGNLNRIIANPASNTLKIDDFLIILDEISDTFVIALEECKYKK